MNQELSDIQAELSKSRGTKDHIANNRWTVEIQENSRKISTSASLIMLKPLTVCISWSSLGGLKGVKPPEAFGERSRD